MDLFNHANKGKFIIHDTDGVLKFIVNKEPKHVEKVCRRTDEYPYKRVVNCPTCGKPLHASASRGKLGKYYPAYHCRRDGDNFRVPLAEFEETITTLKAYALVRTI